MLNLVIWNVEFRRANTADGQALRATIAACEPDIVCITEGAPDFLDLPHRIEADADYGYPLVGNRRKVLLWSRHPWQDVDGHGDPELPPGRYVAGRTLTPIGNVSVHGVCIPWLRAHVETGRRDRRPWEEHVQYLRGLQRILSRTAPGSPTLVAGDYNQSMPRRRAPLQTFQALLDAFPEAMQHATMGPIAPLDLPAIDHVSHTADLEAVSLRALSNQTEDGRQLSDHFGLHLQLRRR